MAVLRDLPYDVKHCILTHLSDRASLAALVGTCTAFRDIYTRHKNTILRRIHHAEATALAPDSLIFAYCLRAIPSIATMATLVGFVKDYETYHSTGVPPTCISTGLIEEPSAYDPSKLANYLVDDYRGIRTIALAHQFPMRESRQEPPLSCTEIRRIMRALYRGWTLMLLLHAQQRLRISDPPPTYGSDSRSYDDYDPNFIERMVLKCWDVWSVLQIRIVMDDSLRMLPSGGPDANDSQALMEFGAQMQRSLVYQIVAPSGDGPGETLIPVLLTPAFQYVDTKAPRSGLNLLLTPGFAGYLFTNCHPATIAPLFTLDPLSGARAAFDRLATVLADQVRQYVDRARQHVRQLRADTDSSRTPPLSWALDTLRKSMMTLSGQRSSGLLRFERIVYCGEVPAMRLVDRKKYDGTFEATAREVGRKSWIQRADVGACVFDEWRLAARGLDMPVFRDGD